jgi:hypothetical protein
LRYLYTAMLQAIIGLRLVAWAHFVLLAAVNSGGTAPWRAVWKALTMPTEEYLRRLLRLALDDRSDATRAIMQQRHRAHLELFRSQTMEAFTLGSLGLAAWAALVVAATTGQSPREIGPSLDLLFVGVGLVLSGPILFARAGVRVAHMGLEGFLAVGYSAIVLWIASQLGPVLGSGWWELAGLALGVTLLLLAGAELRRQLRRNRNLLESPPPGTAS